MIQRDWLHSFVVFAEHENFTRAAEALHLSQPSLHVQVRKLADALGVPLYEKVGRSLRLTEQGRRLAAYGRQTAELDREFIAALRGDAPEGPAVLAAGHGAFLYLLGGTIRKLVRRGHALELLTRDATDALSLVREHKAHVAVGAYDRPPGGMRVEPIRDVGQMVVLPRAHKLAKRKSMRVEHLSGERLVVAPVGRPHRHMLETLLAAQGVSWTVGVEARGWELILHFAQVGLGLAVVNDVCRVPPGMVGVRLVDAPRISYFAIASAGPMAKVAEVLWDALLET